MACGKDHRHQSVAFYLEMDGGSVDPGKLDALGIPDYSGLTFVPIPAIRGARFSEGLEFRSAQLDLDAPHGAQPKPIPVMPVNPDSVARYGAAAGERMRVLQGAHTLPIPYYGEGAGAGADEVLHSILSTSMGKRLPTDKTDAINGAPADANTLVMTNIDRFKVGDVIMHIGGGVNQFTRVVDIVTATSTLKVSPAFTTTPSDGDTIYQCAVFYPKQGETMPTGALRFRMEDREMLSAMARMESMGIDFTDEGIAQFTPVMRPVGVLRNDAAAGAVEPWTQASGYPAVRDQALQVMSDTLVGATAPAVEGVNALNVPSWSVQIDFRLAQCPAPNVLGAEGVTVLSSECVLSLSDRTGVVEDMLLDEDERTLVFSAGPVGAGQGFAVILTAAHNRVASLPEGGADDEQIHSAEFVAGAYALDDTSEQDGDASNVAWCIAFPLAS